MEKDVKEEAAKPNQRLLIKIGSLDAATKKKLIQLLQEESKGSGCLVVCPDSNLIHGACENLS